MQRIILEIAHNSDLQLLLLLAQRIGAKVIMPVDENMGVISREKHLKIIENGGDASYIENPMQWQREQRKERDLPFRD